MNTLDYKPLIYKGDKSFNDIFSKQRIVFDEYMEHEKKNVSTFDINCYEDQQLLKDFLQIRFVEELTEATCSENYDHFEEEIIDAFNFLVEAYIIYGWDYSMLNKWDDTESNDILLTVHGKEYLVEDCNRFRSQFYYVIERVGMICNFLKNRSWKQSQYLVDLYLFEPTFKSLWICFNDLCRNLGIRKKRIYRLWSLKYQVNKFRLESGY